VTRYIWGWDLGIEIREMGHRTWDKIWGWDVGIGTRDMGYGTTKHG